MKIVYSSDWQMHSSNLHLITKVKDQLLEYCVKHKVKHFFHLGDLKHIYDPVEVSVSNFAVKMIKEFIDAGVQWYQIAGNHDRDSMSADSGTWFPVLRAAGAITISRPKMVTASTVRLFCIPYMSDPSALRDALKRAPDADILLFHNEIKGCKSSVVNKLKSGIAYEEFNPKRYKWCIGGHIHMEQKIGDSIFYVGSPFSQDWGEANQLKRFLVYDSVDKQLDSVPFTGPGMYDLTWPGFEKVKPATFKGSKVRIHIACDKSILDTQKFLLKAKIEAERKYKGAEITVIPEYLETKVEDAVTSLSDDEIALQEYVESTCPPYLAKHKEQIISYLKYRLKEKGFIRRSSQTIQFLEAEGRNILNYKRVKVKYTHKGIIVVAGRNKDWKNRSNGTGKTNFLSLPAVILQGRTLKGQANDKWIRRHSTGMAWGKLRLRLQDGRHATITRTRRPVRLKLFIDERDRSTGIGTRGTQLAIDSITGLTWETLRNAIYIDQAEVNEILKGTDTTRKAIFAKLLNLERFELAKEALKQEIKTTRFHIEDAETSLQHSREKVKSIKALLHDVDVSEEFKEVKKEYIRNREFKNRYTKKLKKIRVRLYNYGKKWEALIQKCNDQSKELDIRRDVLLEARGSYKTDITRFNLVEDKCPTCRQDVDSKFKKKRIKLLEEGLVLVGSKVEALDKLLETVEQSKSIVLNKLEGNEEKLKEYKALVATYTEKDIALKDTLNRLSKQVTFSNKHKRKLRKERSKVQLFKATIKAYTFELSLLTYGLQVFSKDGLPAYLIAALCPRLNIATTRYANLISEDEIKIKFIVDEGDIDVKIKNKHGGESTNDQSSGELQIAGLIASFAIREVINPANLLILDEPGAGLDQHNMRLLASVLKEIARAFGCVLVTSHSPIMLAELEDEKKIYIEKDNKIARIVEG